MNSGWRHPSRPGRVTMHTLIRQRMTPVSIIALALVALVACSAASSVGPVARAEATADTAQVQLQADAAVVGSANAPVSVYAQNGASVVSITSLAIVQTVF